MNGADASHSPSGTHVGRTRVLLGLLGLLGIVVRLPGSGGDLWIDEIATVQRFIRLPLAELISSYDANNHILYSILGHVSISWFGETALAVRLPALIFGAATVPALFCLARHWLAHREALAASLILAFSYHHIYFSQNARGYTGYVFLAVASTALLVRGLDADRGRDWTGYAILAAANVYVFLSGLFVAVGQTLGAVLFYALPASGEERVRVWHRLVTWVGVAALLTLALHAPLLRPMIHFFTTARGDVGWYPSLELVRIILRDALPGGGGPVTWVALVMVLSVGAAGAISLARRAPILLFAFVLPPALELAVALSMGAGTYPRRFVLLLPFGILAAVRGVALLSETIVSVLGRPRLFIQTFALLVTMVAGAAAMGLGRLYTIPKQDFSGALDYVAARSGPGDVLAGAYVTDTAAGFYDSTVRSARTLDALEGLMSEGRRIWLLGTLLDDMNLRAPELAEEIRRSFTEEARFPGLVGDGTVVVWIREVEPAP